MDFNDGSEFRVVTDPARHMSEREMFEFRACSADTHNGQFQMYFDKAFTHHREALPGMKALLM